MILKYPYPTPQLEKVKKLNGNPIPPLLSEATFIKKENRASRKLLGSTL